MDGPRTITTLHIVPSSTHPQTGSKNAYDARMDTEREQQQCQWYSDSRCSIPEATILSNIHASTHLSKSFFFSSFENVRVRPLDTKECILEKAQPKNRVYTEAGTQREARTKGDQRDQEQRGWTSENRAGEEGRERRESLTHAYLFMNASIHNQRSSTEYTSQKRKRKEKKFRGSNASKAWSFQTRHDPPFVDRLLSDLSSSHTRSPFFPPSCVP